MTDNTPTENTTPAEATHTVPELDYVTPRADVWASDEGSTILLDLPGVAADGLDLHVDGNSLVIRARSSTPPVEGEPLQIEWSPTHFHRTFRLAQEADASRIEASVERGVLRVFVPRAEAAKPRRIPVNVG